MPFGHPDWRPPRPSAGGVLRTTLAAPGAGNQWTFTVPADELWRPVGIFAQYTTAAGGSNRSPFLRFRRGVNLMFDVPFIATQPPSVTWEYQWFRGAGGSWSNGQAAGNGAQAASMPDLILLTGDVMLSQVNFGAAGDTWGGPILIYELV